MFPVAVTSGNAFVLKPSKKDPGNPHIPLFDVILNYPQHGKWMYLGSEDGTVKMWDLRQNLPKSMLQLRNCVGIEFGGDSKEDEGSGDSKKKCLSTMHIDKDCQFMDE